MVQDDNATPHRNRYLQKVLSDASIKTMVWPANSPDLNPIEKAWIYIKRRVTARGCPHTKAELEAAFEREWKQLPIEQVRKWIEAIPRHIRQVIQLEGGNNYKEGRDLKRGYKGERRIGKLSNHTYLRSYEAGSEADQSELQEAPTPR